MRAAAWRLIVSFGHFMWVLLAFFVAAVHVPYRVTRREVLPHVSLDDFVTYRPRSALVFVGAGIYGDKTATRRAMKQIASMSVVFGDSAFMWMDRSDAYTWIEKWETLGPLMLFFGLGPTPVVCEVPKDEEELLFLIENQLKGPGSVVQSCDELKSFLDQLPLTLIVRPGQYDRAKDVMKESMIVTGPVFIVEATGGVFDHLNMSGTQTMLFRKADDVIEPCELGADDIIRAAKPFYCVADPATLFDSSLYLGVFGGQDVAIKYRDVLFELSQKFPEFKIVAVPPEFHDTLVPSDSTWIKSLPDVKIFNVKGGFYYPNDGMFDNIDFPSDQFWQICADFVEQVRTGRIARKYGSEQPSDMIYEGVVHKIVGANYEQFIQGRKPTIMLYDVNTWPDMNIIQEIKQLVNVIGDTVQFGVINPTLNSFERGYPMLLPTTSAVIFLRNGTAVNMFEPMTFSGFTRFLNRTAPDLVRELDMKPLSMDEALKEMDALIAVSARLKSPEGKSAIQDYIVNHLVPISKGNPFAAAVEKYDN